VLSDIGILDLGVVGIRGWWVGTFEVLLIFVIVRKVGIAV
jgi:hypothetical protein